jgi:hypothetical protein
VNSVTTIAAWHVAWAVVLALLALLGDEVGSLPLALRAPVISGLLVALMVNLVMPVLGPPRRALAAVNRRNRKRADWRASICMLDGLLVENVAAAE